MTQKYLDTQASNHTVEASMMASQTSSTIDMASSNESSAPIFGEAAQLLIACNQKLQELGIDDTIKLPRITVIGDQSTGKSSLIEAISSVSVPKASGLCTKCPIAINLSHEDNVDWRCSVYIEEKFSYHPTQSKVTESCPLGPWKMQPNVTTTFVNSTENRGELPDLINLAQRLVLNPLRDQGAPLGLSLPAEDHEKFSPNTIRLDISAKGWANLSFVDLPGVVTRSGGLGQPTYYVNLVENLARQFARDKNNIVMLTLPLNHDNDNSKSYSIIESEQVHSRTMTVFTKVDLANPEQRDQCLRQYFDEESPEEFEYGVHMVVLTPDEQQFFAQEIWGDMFNIQHKFGIPNLVNRIRGILFQQTRETLPHNLKSIEERLEEIERLLGDLPAPPDTNSLPWKLREQFIKFEMHVQELFSHGSASRTALNTRMEIFADRISQDKPTIRYKTQDEREELEEAQKSLRDDSEVADVGDDEDLDEDKSPSKKSTKPDVRSHQFTLEEIYILNKRHCGSGVGGEIEPKAVEKMNILSVQFFDKSLDAFSKGIRTLIKKHVQECIDKDFDHQKHLPLYQNVCDLATKFLDVAISNGKQLMDQRCAAEKETPFTLDNESRLKLEKAILRDRLQIRKEVRLQMARTIQKASHTGSKKTLKLVEENSLEADEWELEIQMSAKSAAYYDLASKRFVDNVCQDLLTHLIPRIQTQLVKSITEKLGLHDIEANQTSIAELMSENPKREAKRRRLLKEQENLRAGHQYIVNVLDSVQPIYSGELTDTVMEDEDEVEKTPTPVKTPRPSPSKRKAQASTVDIDADTDATAEAETPTKRPKRAAAGKTMKNRSVRLPTRDKSIEIED